LERAAVYRRIGTAYFKKGDLPRSAEALEAGIGLVGERVPTGTPALIASIVREIARYGAIRLASTLFGRYRKPRDDARARAASDLFHSLTWLYGYGGRAGWYVLIVLRMVNTSWTRLGPSKELGRALAYLGGVVAAATLFTHARRYHLASLKMQETHGDEDGRAEAKMVQSITALWAGRHAECTASAEEALVYYRRIGDIWNTGTCLQQAAFSAFYTGRYDMGFASLRELIVFSERTRDAFNVAAARAVGCMFLAELGDYERAEAEGRQSLELGIRDLHGAPVFCAPRDPARTVPQGRDLPRARPCPVREPDLPAELHGRALSNVGRGAAW
jgi:tetratricopeptide (TPR) repeat protein